MKKLFKWGAILLGVLIIGVAFLGEEEEGAQSVSTDVTNEETASTDGTNEETASAETEAPSPEDQVFKVGETVELGDIQITINSASFTKPEQYSEAKNGKVITLEVTAKNNGSTDAFVSSMEFNVATPDGNMAEEYYGYNDLAISGDIKEGKQLQGKLYFDVPDADYYELYYEPTFSWSGDEILWKIEKSELQ